MKKEYTIFDSVPLIIEGEHKEKEVDAIASALQEKLGDSVRDLLSVTATAKDENFDLHYEVKQPKFERIRRITGYLVGTTDRWNNAKQAEEHERVKHF